MSRWRRGFVTNVLFPCPPSSYTIDSFPGELVWIPKGPVIDANGPGSGGLDAPPGCETVPCLLLPCESARFLIIFFHSNAEDLGRCRWFCHFLRDQFQVHVLAVEYPGYGVCPGVANREGVVAHAHAALQFATQALELPLEQIKVFGRSIGTGPALHLAAKFKVAGVILVTPFLCVKTLFKDRVGPLSLLIDEWFQNDEAILSVQSPTMIIHGRKDNIIRWQHSEALYQTCPARKLFINPASMEHNTNLSIDISYLIVPMFRFFSLPDYCFQDLKVPSWAFDKRRSPLYVRPDIEVCSHASVKPSTGQGCGGLSLPAGDDEEDGAPVDQAQDAAPAPLKEPKDLQGRARSAPGDQPVVDYEKVTVLTQPTVLHSYKATKQSYNFKLDLQGCEVPPDGHGPSEDMPLAMLQALRRKPMGNHISASRPPTTNGSPVRERPRTPISDGVLVPGLRVVPFSGASRGRHGSGKFKVSPIPRSEPQQAATLGLLQAPAADQDFTDPTKDNLHVHSIPLDLRPVPHPDTRTPELKHRLQPVRPDSPCAPPDSPSPDVKRTL